MPVRCMHVRCMHLRCKHIIAKHAHRLQPTRASSLAKRLFNLSSFLILSASLCAARAASTLPLPLPLYAARLWSSLASFCAVLLSMQSDPLGISQPVHPIHVTAKPLCPPGSRYTAKTHAGGMSGTPMLCDHVVGAYRAICEHVQHLCSQSVAV